MLLLPHPKQHSCLPRAAALLPAPSQAGAGSVALLCDLFQCRRYCMKSWWGWEGAGQPAGTGIFLTRNCGELLGAAAPHFHTHKLMPWPGCSTCVTGCSWRAACSAGCSLLSPGLCVGGGFPVGWALVAWDAHPVPMGGTAPSTLQPGDASRSCLSGRK